MAFITAETRSDLIEISVAMLKQAPSAELLEELIALSVAGGTLLEASEHIAKTDAFKAEYPSFQTAEQYATEILDNITTGGTMTADIRTAVIDLATGMLTSGAVTKAGLAYEIASFLAAPAALLNADFADIAQSFQNRADAAEYFVVSKELGGSTVAELAASIASVTSAADTLTAANASADSTAAAEDVVAGQTVTLTTGLDTGSTFTSANGNDMFTAQETGVATTDTLTTGDNLTGGAGTDTLTIAASGTPAGGTTAGVVTSGIEALSIYNNSTSDYELDAALMAGVTDVYVNGGSNATTVSGLASIPNLHLISTNKNATVTSTAVSGAADEAIILSNGAAQTTAMTATYEGLEVINFNAAGTTGLKSASADTSLTLASTSLEKVVVTGDAAANLTVSLAGAVLETQTAEFDASAAGGVITAHVTKGASANAAVTMSAQADYLDYNGALASTITLDGGDGLDYLDLDTNVTYSATATAQSASGVSDFEVIRLASGVTVDERSLVNNAGITAVVAFAGGAYTKSTALASISQLTSGTFVTTVATDGTADALTLNLPVGATTSTLSAANVEALTVASGGAAANAVVMTASGSADLTSITAVGTQPLNISVSGTSLATVDAAGVTGIGSLFTLTASASTADMTVTASANRPTTSETGTANNITTGSGDDTITGDIYADIISAGNGDNTVAGGAGNNQITTGRGDDTITAGDGSNTIVTGNGDNTVTIGGTATSVNSITFGSGDDTLTSGAGKDTVTLGAGDDTVDTGAGADNIYMSDYDDDDVIEGGAGADALSASVLATAVAQAAAGAQIQAVGTYVDLTPGTSLTSTPVVTGVESVYMDVNIAATNAGSATTSETVNFAGTTGISNLYLGLTDADNTSQAKLTLSDVDAAAIHLVTGSTVDDLTTLVIGGAGQASLTVKGHGYTDGTALTVTAVDAVTLTSYQSNTTLTVDDTVFGAVLADDSDTVTVTSLSTTAALSGGTLTVGTVSADDATTIALNAGSNNTLVVGALTSTSDGLDTITATVSDDGTLTPAGITSTGGELTSVVVSLGVNSNSVFGGNLDVEDTAAGTITVGAASSLTIPALMLGGSATTIIGTASSTINIGIYGKTGHDASTITISGRGDLDETITLNGDTTLNLAGWVDTNAAGITIITTGNDDMGFIGNALAADVTAGDGDNTITTGSLADDITTGDGEDVVSSGAGADTIVTGGGDDAINGGAGADTVTPGTGADTVTATSGDTIIFTAGDSQTGAAIVSGTTALATADVITAPTTAAETLVINLAAMGSTIADVAVSALAFGTTVMAGVTANEILIIEGTLDSDNVFTAVADGTTGNTHTLIQVDTNGATAGGVENILVVGVFDDASSSITGEVLTLVV